MTSQQRLLDLLAGNIPDRVPFSPNLWQWFEYQKLHRLLPPELKACESHGDVLRILGVDIFARNLKTDIRTQWFGGHVRVAYQRVAVEEMKEENRRQIIYHTPCGDLTEAYFFQEEGCTLVQTEPAFKDFDREFPAWKALIEDRVYDFDPESFQALSAEIGSRGIVIAGEITSPLKQLHILARADQTTYLLVDHEPEMLELMAIYTEKALALIETMAHAGVKVIMSMDNLDSLFYPPPYFDRYCADFFTRAAEICHRHGACFFSHACGKQHAILSRVVACGIDGLEGIAFPPLGDVELWDARQAGEKFIAVGGLSAVQLEGEVTAAQAEDYVRKLFDRMRPFHRFVFSMSCNTSIHTSWDTLRYYRDAWLKHGAA